ncbi:MAG TPA: protein-glutamine glutaminase family protein [Gammaproteobacteria bacterium]|jgi:hypothetical protein|nr:protein-glutamine glutaminase family protein [Gammaproteobacteria bacterium]
MFRQLNRSFIWVFTPVLFAAFLNTSHAAESVSIRNSSIAWDDIDNRIKLLTSAPGWDEGTLKAMFAVYHDVLKNGLPQTSNPKQYNVEYINGMWGPLGNPFAKSQRPVKAFVSFTNSSEYLMVPLIKDLNDSNFYIFESSVNQPVLLNDWIADVAAKHGGVSNIKFNICDGYADSIDDSCSDKAYQNEISDALNENSAVNGFRLAAAHSGMASAKRNLGEDWTTKVNSTRAVRALSESIYNSSVLWNNKNSRTKLLNTVTTWPNLKIIQENFEKIRDIRYFNDSEFSGFKRRISWLYPDDGCWTRATAVIKDLFGPFNNPVNNYERPSKIFAFGNLCVNTDNHPAGYVSWWYHTAPVVRDASTNQVYVIDPAVNSKNPLTVEQWMSAISANNGRCGHGNSVSQFNICNGYGTNPGSNCNSSFAEEESTDMQQPGYQYSERSRMSELGRDANKVLGDNPPWLN